MLRSEKFAEKGKWHKGMRNQLNDSAQKQKEKPLPLTSDINFRLVRIGNRFHNYIYMLFLLLLFCVVR